MDELGLDRLDRAVLDAICRRFGGGPVGLSTLAISVGEERETVEEVAEPFLVRQGFLMRTQRGRVATTAAWRHLGLAPPARRPLATSARRTSSAPTCGLSYVQAFTQAIDAAVRCRLGRDGETEQTISWYCAERAAPHNRMPEQCSNTRL